MQATAAAQCTQGTCLTPAATTCTPGICGVTACATVVSVAGGYDFTCAVLSDETVSCWGTNHRGQSGTPPNLAQDDILVPTRVPGLTGVDKVVTGYAHACALMKDRTVKCWGSNGYGQLGLGTKDTQPHPLPETVPGLSNITSLAAGGGDTSHMCAVAGGGNIWCWGANDYGQLGVGTYGSTAGRLSPTQVCWTGSISTSSCNVLTSATSVAAGDFHTCVRLLSGAVVCFGSNGSGELGQVADGQAHPNPLTVGGVNAGFTSATPVAAGESNSCAVLTDNTVKCWGRNTKGQLANGTNTSSGTPTFICNPSAGSCSGTNMQVVAIALGETHSCMVSAGAVRCSGYHNNGALGDGTPSLYQTNVASAIAVPSGAVGVMAGSYHSCALLNDGSLRCWGWNGNSQLGAPDAGDESPSPVTPSW
jgi:alpha-tubulin suppressor-like RCC1 family protein